MKQFFTHIKKSIYGPEYYQDLLARPFSYSFKYFATLAFLIALFLTIVTSVPLIPLIEKQLREFPDKFFAYYPDELEVRIDKGVVSTNVAEPYFLPLPTIMKDEAAPTKDLTALLVIDTKTPFSIEKFHEYKTFAWLGETQFTTYDQNGSLRISAIGKNSQAVVNEGELRRFASELKPYYKIVSPLLVLIILLGLLLAFSVKLVYLFFGALFILLLGRMMKQKFSYGTAYRLGLHAITLPILLGGLATIFGFPLEKVPFLPTAIMLGVVFVNLKDGGTAGAGQTHEEKKDETGTPPSLPA